MNAKGKKNEYGWGTARDLLADATVNSGSSVTTSGLTTVTDFGLTYSDFSFYAGSGGGISLVEPQPSYQASVVPSILATSLNEASGYTVTLPTPMRVVPDVAMVGDPYTGYLYGETYTIAGNYSDTGCTALTSTTEYCEMAIGGTSLASPLMAGMIAVVDQKHLESGKPLVGFANPWLYGAKIGATTNSAGINDIVAPASPTAVLRGYVSDDNEVRVVTINSVPFVVYPTPFALEVCSLTICEGLDDVFNYVTPGYDDVTGLGVPYAPYLIKQ
jgi:subtilase family serine protease